MPAPFATANNRPGSRSPMPPTIIPERPDSPNAIALITELQTHLESFYPPESRHGLSVEKLLTEGGAFFVLRDAGQPAGCGGIKLFPGFGELKRMYVRPQLLGRGFGQLVFEALANHALTHDITTLRLE